MGGDAILERAVTREDVEQRVLETLQLFGVDAEEVADDAPLRDLELDSMDLLELAQVVEDEYRVEITVDDAQRIETIRDFTDLIVTRLGSP